MGATGLESVTSNRDSTAGSAGAATLSVSGWGGVHPLAIGQVRSDSAPRVKVGQTVGCSTFTRGTKPATRRVADGERMNPREGWRVRANTEDDEHQGDKHLENCLHPGARRPRTPLSMGSPPLVFYHPAACAARGRIFPAPARGTRTPGVSMATAKAAASTDWPPEKSKEVARR